MPGLAEIASIMITGAERRIDLAAVNISNLNTPGYRTRRVFADLLGSPSGLPIDREAIAAKGRIAALTQTGNPLDFAADAGTVMALRSPTGYVLARTAQLRRDADGRLIDGQGRALQSIDGGDLIVSSGMPTVTDDGVVLVAGQPQGRIGLFSPSQSGGFADFLPEVRPAGTVKQGMVVGSDVELSDEMLELNKASRMAETGARVFQLHDDLLAKTASQLGTIAR